LGAFVTSFEFGFSHALTVEFDAIGEAIWEADADHGQS
tara:strand:+ start:2787 stop:2900 length:114 start_codon:yes stop_codon:yes gene_type:complete